MERAVFVPDLDRLPPPEEEHDRLYLGSEFCVSGPGATSEEQFSGVAWNGTANAVISAQRSSSN